MAVIDSSSLIALGKIGRLELLKLFKEIIITEKVFMEILEKPESEESVLLKEAVNNKWIKVSGSEEIKSSLGAGEASSIHLAVKLNKILITDDKKAVFIASSLGIECHGTLYVVLLALKKKILKNKKEAVDIVNMLVANKLYLSSDVLMEFYSLLERIN